MSRVKTVPPKGIRSLASEIFEHLDPKSDDSLVSIERKDPVPVKQRANTPAREGQEQNVARSPVEIPRYSKTGREGHMRVILLCDLRNLGRRGEIVDVNPAYARNYLLPQGLALGATETNIKYFEKQTVKIEARHTREREVAALKIREKAVSVASRWNDVLGPFYSARQAAQICGGVSEQQLDESRERHALLGLKTADGVLVYPAFQFDEQNRVLSGLPEILRCFPVGHIDAWALAGWLVSPLRGLDGLSVAQWLREGRDLAPVLVLARDAARRFSQ